MSVSIIQDSHKIFTGVTTTRTVRFQPNGAGCDPIVYQARVTAHVKGQLTS